MDVEFKGLTYRVKDSPTWKSKGPKKVILDTLSGCFKSGELTAILGMSGAGKSSLLNVLSGYRSKGVCGTLLTNGRPRDEKVFRSCSCYITQDDLLQPLLTVQELMTLAATLKMPADTSAVQAQRTIDEILGKLGLAECTDTRTEHLSGGEKKRLSVALELVDNPPVVFLDEPTSGLDNVSAKHCLQMLRTLAHQGRTIVCTIHQPSAVLFDLFDQVYVMAHGRCVFQGTAPDLLPYLASLGLRCPLNYNPADYVIELTDAESLDNVRLMTAAVDNGNLVWKSPATRALDADRHHLEATSEKINGDLESSESSFLSQKSTGDLPAPATGYASSQWTQFITILRRMFLQIWRNKTSLGMQLFHHVLSSTLLGLIFYDSANDGVRWFLQLKCALGLVVFHTYTWCIVPILTYPSEVKLLQREHFNRWYGLTPYYMALTVSTAPSKIILSTIFLTIIYFSIGLPFEVERFTVFCLIGILTSFAAEGLGLAIGSTFTVTNGAAIGPACIVPLTGLAVYGFGFPKAIPLVTRWLMLTSFVRSGFVAMTITMFGMDRPPLGCSDKAGYCHFGDPAIVLRMLDLDGSSVWAEIILLCVLLLVFRVLFAVMLRARLK